MWRLGLILLLSAALGPLSLRAEAPIGRFVIGVWSPAGWSGADYDSYDRFFTASDAPLVVAAMAIPPLHEPIKRRYPCNEYDDSL